MADREHLGLLCDAAALLYHQARKAGHLRGRGIVDDERWRYLAPARPSTGYSLASLDGDRDDSWRRIAPVRRKAHAAESADAVLGVFEERFRVSLRELTAVFKRESWRGAKLYGGRAGAAIDEWAVVLSLTLGFAAALRAESASAVAVAHDLRTAWIDGGSFTQKLDRLDRARPRAERRARKQQAVQWAWGGGYLSGKELDQLRRHDPDPPWSRPRRWYWGRADACPACGTPPVDLAWIRVPWGWARLRWPWRRRRRCGWVTVCDRCQLQVSFLAETK